MLYVCFVCDCLFICLWDCQRQPPTYRILSHSDAPERRDSIVPNSALFTGLLSHSLGAQNPDAHEEHEDPQLQIEKLFDDDTGLSPFCQKLTAAHTADEDFVELNESTRHPPSSPSLHSSWYFGLMCIPHRSSAQFCVVHTHKMPRSFTTTAHSCTRRLSQLNGVHAHTKHKHITNLLNTHSATYPFASAKLGHDYFDSMGTHNACKIARAARSAHNTLAMQVICACCIHLKMPLRDGQISRVHYKVMDQYTLARTTIAVRVVRYAHNKGRTQAPLSVCFCPSSSHQQERIMPPSPCCRVRGLRNTTL